MYTSSTKGSYPSTGSTSEKIRDAAEEGVKKAASTVYNTFDATRRTVSQATDTTAQQIRNHPLQSTLIAMGVGYIIARLMNRGHY